MLRGQRKEAERMAAREINPHLSQGKSLDEI